MKAVRGKKPYCFFSMCVYLHLSAFAVVFIRASNWLSAEEALPPGTALNRLPQLQGSSDIFTDAKTGHPAIVHQNRNNFFPSISLPSTKFLALHPNTTLPRTLCEAHAGTAGKTAATPEGSTSLSIETHDSNNQNDRGLNEGERHDYSFPARTFSPSTVIPISPSPGAPLSLPFGPSKADEWLTTFLFRMWAALHPQDAAYYVDLSQKAASPTFTSIADVRDIVSHLEFNPRPSATHDSSTLDFSGTTLQSLLMELLTRNSDGASTVREVELSDTLATR